MKDKNLTSILTTLTPKVYFEWGQAAGSIHILQIFGYIHSIIVWQHCTVPPFPRKFSLIHQIQPGRKRYAVCPHGELVGDFHGFGATASIKNRHLLIHNWDCTVAPRQLHLHMHHKLKSMHAKGWLRMATTMVHICWRLVKVSSQIHLYLKHCYKSSKACSMSNTLHTPNKGFRKLKTMEDAPLHEGVGSTNKTKVKWNWPLVDHQNQHHPCLLLSLGQLVGEEWN